MRIFKALASGFCRTLKVWKGILLLWLTSLLLVSMAALPLKNFLNAGFGKSMITERLADGPDIAALGDLINEGLGNMVLALPSVFFLVVFLGILISAFLSGGIFDSLNGSAGRFTGSRFFSACASNFLPFLVISLIIMAIIIFAAVIVIAIPFGIVKSSGSSPGSAQIITIQVSAAVLVLLVAVLLLVADYARAWQAASKTRSCFRALGFGFTRTFGTFLSSFPVMILVIIVQLLFSFFIMKLINGWKPVTGGGVFLLFIVSQIIFFLKAGLKVWRYGSVTALKEIND